MIDAPLRECLGLLAGLAVLAWPLAQVTAPPRGSPPQVVEPQTAEGLLVTDVSVKSAHPFEWMELRRDSIVLGRIEGPTLEGEFECDLAPHGERLIVAAHYGEKSPETAMRLQLWAGAMPEVEMNFWVDGDLLEEVEVQFHE